MPNCEAPHAIRFYQTQRWRVALGSLCLLFFAIGTFGDDLLKKLIEDQRHKDQIETSRKLGEQMAQNLTDARNLKAEFDDKIEAARRRFWATYPDKSGHEQARSDFAALLRAKDLYYMQNNLTFRADDRTRAQQGPGATAPISRVLESATGQLDGGVRQRAKPEFYDWVDAVHDHLLSHGTHEISSLSDLHSYLSEEPGRIVSAVEQSQSEYEVYVVARDWAEFDAAGREPAGANNPYVYGALMFMRFERVPWDDAVTDYVTMANLMGVSETEPADKKVHAAPKDNGGFINDMLPLGLETTGVPDRKAVIEPGKMPIEYSNPRNTIVTLVSCCDARRYLLQMLAPQRSPATLRPLR